MIVSALNRVFGFILILLGVIGFTMMTSRKNLKSKTLIALSSILPLIGFGLLMT
ncbi:hypothetical protein [Clostridium frigidicarnis]|uniref:DUF3953 domain-containing protein n=1 Tax=Clostridium frigidicarnis TaxID=84698 RepID=A0A1I0ZCW6_9CLOT|nr:hypothetical protein [Clostridium frigidicarnis]SFB22053.1 hypothetical protein SAMN04488528_101859 [Clostridium frigidicarnis]